MNTSTPSSVAVQDGGTPESLPVRLARSTALVVLVFIFTLLIALALLSSSTFLSDALRPIFTWADVEEKAYTGWLVLTGLALIPILLLVLIWRLKLRSWWWIGGGYLAAAPILVYLAIDDPAVVHATRVEEIAPAFPGAENSYAVLMQYSKQAPSEEAKAFANWKQRITGLPVAPDKREEWFAYLQQNRAAIEADWADIAPQRRWLTELNAFDRIGDLAEASHSANIISFQVWRLLSQRSLHIAGLHELDGRPDEAIATLLPMLHASRKLQPSARSLVRIMVGIVVEKMTTNYAIHLLERNRVSPETKARLAAVLVGGVRGEAGARRLIGIENAFLLNPVFERPLGDLMSEITPGGRSLPRPLLNLISPFVYNPHRTCNLMGAFNRELQELAARRDPMSSGRADELYAQTMRPRFKNYVGTILAERGTPAYTKVVKSYWELNDARDKLAVLATGT